MGFLTMDEWISEVTVNGKYWRAYTQKSLGAVGAFTIGRWYDMSMLPGTPMLARHGELLANGQLLSNSTGWTLPAGWTWSATNKTIVKTAGVANGAQIALTGGTVTGIKYALEYYLSVNAASTIIPQIGGTDLTTRTATAGYYFEIMGSNTVSGGDLYFNTTTTTTATISNVSVVRPLRAVQLFDTDMGAIFHGGNVSTDTKHALNAGIASVAANFVPGTWILVDYLMAFPGINMNVSTEQTLDPVDVVVNGTFTADTDWTKPAGWTWDAGNFMKKDGDGTGDLTPSVALVAIAGIVYKIKYTISNWTVGDVTASFGGTSGTTRSANGTYTEIVTASSTGTLNFTPTNTSRFNIDDVSVTLALPRYSDGKGVRAMLVWHSGSHFAASNATSTAAHNISMSYSAPCATCGATSGRGLPVVVAGMSGAVPVLGHIDNSGVAANNYGPFLPLASGDTGIVSTESITISAATGANNIGTLLLVKPLLTLPNTTAAIATERDLMNQLPSLPRIYDGAKLGWIFHPGAATAVSTTAYSWLDFCWG